MPFFSAYNLVFIFFLVALGVSFWYVFSIIYHLIRFGVGLAPKILALIFLAGSILFYIVLFYLFRSVDWPYFLNQLGRVLSDIFK